MGRKIVIVRHGERVDFTFGDEWVQNCFDASGKYAKKNLNMPDAVPHRNPQDFLGDCPLTQIGSLQGKLVGKGLFEENILQPGFQVIVSPALRSVETAAAILSGMGHSSQKLNVEPGMFEWTGYHKKIPSFMTPDALSENGFEINLNYKPLIPLSELSLDEKSDDYYKRSYEMVKAILEKDENDLLLVGHGCSLDALSRELTGNPQRTLTEMFKINHGVPYCGVAIVEKVDNEGWKIISAASSNISMKHSSAADFCAYSSFMA